MRPLSVTYGLLASALTVLSLVSPSEGMARFPTTLSQNTTGSPDSRFTGAPDGLGAAIGGGEIVTYDFGPGGVPFFNIIDSQDFNVYQWTDDSSPAFENIDVLVSSDGSSFTSVKGTEDVKFPFILDPTADSGHGDDTYARSYDVPDAFESTTRYIQIVGLGEPGTGTGFSLDAIGAQVDDLTVPEPSSLLLLGVGTAMLLRRRSRRD